MVKEALEFYGGEASYSSIRSFIRQRYGNVNESTINCQIIRCTVNHNSRVNFPTNTKARIANTDHDFLFSVSRGMVELYDPKKHGIWKISVDNQGKPYVCKM